MSDHEFEKQVHQKMQELKLRPSDSVWMEVEKNIRHGKRRRRFAWLWVAALFVGVTTSGYILYRYAWQNDATTNVAEAASKQSSTQKTTGSTNSTLNTPNKNNTASQPAGENNQPTGDNTPNAATPQTGAAEPATGAPVTSAGTAYETGNPNEIPPAPAAIENNPANNSITNKNSRPAGSQLAAVTTDKPRYRKKKGTREAIVRQKPVQQELMTFNDAVQTTEADEHVLNGRMPALVVGPDNAIATQKAAPAPFNSQFPLLMPDSSGISTAHAAAIPRRKASLWHWGVVADAGYSRIAESKLFQLRGLLGQEKYLAEDLSARSSANVAPSGSGNQQLNFTSNTFPVRSASAIQPDFSFSAGLFVQRTLSPRLKISIGLEYAYMSVNTQVGKWFDSAIDVNIGSNNLKVVDHFYGTPGYIDTARGGMYANFQTVDQNKVYYSQKQRYRFHYIEIPLLLNWQINKGRKLPPVAFEGGISIGQLISAQALHFEGVKGVYYEDNSLLNKTQLNFVTGLNVGLFQHSKHPVWIGPNLRYALNGLVKKDVSSGQYLWSTGLSVKMMLGRL
ncbi:outer membrane beta-barrel protein [Longitalea luteola]|uniref:outer membrane beta-barrel protein n=1 Tax=Longitalea luteola TaxID=2812563 RepID=UPI001A977D0A|nr:outer membrane beta-barrel protein [Longitalea luteola]